MLGRDRTASAPEHPRHLGLDLLLCAKRQHILGIEAAVEGQALAEINLGGDLAETCIN